MFRVIRSFKALKISAESVGYYSTYDPAMLPVKKCHRKPRWQPIAKSKRFRVPERTKIPEDEEKEILRLHNNYRNNVKSIRMYLIKKHCTLYQASLDPEEILKHFKADLEKCKEINDKWNAETKILREKRLAEELEEELNFAHKQVEEEIIKEEQIYQLAEDIVKREKEASVNFITPENIDEAIDKALTETVDYNFALTTNGEKILGRDTRPVKEKEKVSLKQ